MRFHTYTPYSGHWLDALKEALVRALLESGEVAPKMVEEGYLSLEGGGPVIPDAVQDVTGHGTVDEARVGPFPTHTAEELELARMPLRAQKKDTRQIIMMHFLEGKRRLVS